MAAIDPQLTAEQRQEAMKQLNNQLGVDARAVAPSVLASALQTITTVDLTATAGPNSTKGEAYLAAIGQVGEYVQKECGIQTGG